jgi:hypothetical protein
MAVLAAMRSIRRDTVASHATAARLLGLPRPMAGWGEVMLTAGAGRTRHRDGVHVRVAPLADRDVCSVADVRVTSPARSVGDCLRTLPPRDALAIADAAVHRRLASVADVEAALAECSGWPGLVRARSIAALIDARRETPLESRSAWAFHLERIPMPQWQVVITDAGGRFIGRIDAWWPEGVAGEADGRSKYALAAAERGGLTARNLFSVLDAERRRERLLRDSGAEVVRWSATDVLGRDPLRALTRRLLTALADAQARPRFTGAAP